MLLLVVMAVTQYAYQQQREPDVQAPTSISAPELNPAQVDGRIHPAPTRDPERTVVVYPPDYTTTLAAEVRHRVVPADPRPGSG